MKSKLKWNYKEIIIVFIGIFINSLAVNLFIVPNHLYSGGIMGVSQLIRTFLLNTFSINVKFDMAVPIYYVINIPLFVLAYKKLGETFFFRTLFCVTINTILLAIIPVLEMPLTDDLLTNILIGGVLSGVGAGMYLSVGTSTGGTDIIAYILAKKIANFSLGTFGMIFNFFVYTICGIIGGIETMIYSVLFSIFSSVAVDKTHIKNINSTVLIITKEKPEKIAEFIRNRFDRGSTYWEAVGGYSNEKVYIVYATLSKYEKINLNMEIKDIDSSAFMVMDDGVKVFGNFDKRLI